MPGTPSLIVGTGELVANPPPEAMECAVPPNGSGPNASGLNGQSWLATNWWELGYSRQSHCGNRRSEVDYEPGTAHRRHQRIRRRQAHVGDRECCRGGLAWCAHGAVTPGGGYQGDTPAGGEFGECMDRPRLCGRHTVFPETHAEGDHIAKLVGEGVAQTGTKSWSPASNT